MASGQIRTRLPRGRWQARVRLYGGTVTLFSAVVTTGIYCRPGCGARPRAENVRTFELAAAAEAAGFRACLRCRPYRVAGPVGPAPEMVCQAVQLIIDGVLDRGTEASLAARLAVSPRHLRRMFHDHLGVTPDQLARSRRAHFARRLLDDSELSIADVAFASGFGSLRQFNRDMREVFRASPGELRSRRRRADRLAADGGLTMRLPFQPPYDWEGMAGFLAARAVPGVESVLGGVYRRTISLDGAPGVLEVHPGGDDHLILRAHLPYWEGLIHVVERASRMVGTDADAHQGAAHLAADPAIGPLVSARPGIRVPGAWGAFEVAVHALVAQDCGLPEASARLGALARAFGPPVPGLTHGLTHLFPSPETIAGEDLTVTGIPSRAAEPVRELAALISAGKVALDSSLALPDLVTTLTAIPGVTESAAQQVALRLGHRDAFPAADPRIRHALGALGITLPAGEAAGAWQPWRAIAAAHLMGSAAVLCKPGPGAVPGEAFLPGTAPSGLPELQQLVVDLHELLDQPGELPGDEFLVGRRAGVRVIGRLIRKVLNEQQVVRLGRVTVDPERQRSGLVVRAPGRELRDDGLALGLLAGLEVDRENLDEHGVIPSWLYVLLRLCVFKGSGLARPCPATSGHASAGNRGASRPPRTAVA